MATTVSARRAGDTGQGATGDESGDEVTSVNEVTLVGRLAAPAEQRELPSGDTLVTFRLIIDRPEGRSSGGRSARSPKVDTVDCAAWRADVRRAALRWAPGARVEVQGALRRRFWRTAAGPVSRVEVEVASARRRR